MTSCSLSARSSWPKCFRNTSTSHSPTSRGVPMPTSFILCLPSSQLSTESRSWLNEKNLIIREGEEPSFSWIAYMNEKREKNITLCKGNMMQLWRHLQIVLLQVHISHSPSGGAAHLLSWAQHTTCQQMWGTPEQAHSPPAASPSTSWLILCGLSYNSNRE